ncbi:SDR family oxidoreductase [Effusibacillus lacus]|uniref:3-ketoacyl-ACP reductase n=1 Tax=Effusibacillus lacus TaxID=1348429 RepID=A0A292YN50_9BACL|nr:SDR family oxidoreductase [Effusibacillus lacus]TCS68265.1 3-oxoacyl-[acyl-carrier protein] reductase [Effusibacillus lacus]GAX90183.1 3-ketoacyl-ACP reductase [Effusibacillus lacus]
MLLKGKVAIITGAGSGMGRATALLFAEQGAKIVAADLNLQAAEETVRQIRGEAITVQADVADDAQVKAMTEQTIRSFGCIDILVNNAGVPMSFTPIEQVKEEQWEQIMNVNVKSIYLTAKYAVPYMKEKGEGVIVNTASIAGIRARPGLNAYCASKGAAIMLTKALAIELAPYKIRVNAINPGPAETPMLSKFVNGDKEKVEKDIRDVFLNSVPLGALIQPEDIAQAALYLCSDMAKMVTGEVVNVDGGRGI